MFGACVRKRILFVGDYYYYYYFLFHSVSAKLGVVLYSPVVFAFAAGSWCKLNGKNGSPPPFCSAKMKKNYREKKNKEEKRFHCAATSENPNIWTFRVWKVFILKNKKKTIALNFEVWEGGFVYLLPLIAVLPLVLLVEFLLRSGGGQ